MGAEEIEAAARADRAQEIVTAAWELSAEWAECRRRDRELVLLGVLLGYFACCVLADG